MVYELVVWEERGESGMGEKRGWEGDGGKSGMRERRGWKGGGRGRVICEDGRRMGEGWGEERYIERQLL